MATTPPPAPQAVLPDAPTSQVTKASKHQRPTRLSCSLRYRLGLAKSINKPTAQSSLLRDSETPGNGLPSSPKASSTQLESRRHSSPKMLKTSKSSEEIESNLGESITKSLSQLDSTNSYSFENSGNAISVKIHGNASCNDPADVNEIQNPFETASNCSNSSHEGNYKEKSTSKTHPLVEFPRTTCRTAQSDELKASSSKILEATEIINFDLKEDVNGKENLKEKAKSSVQNDTIFHIQQRSFWGDAMKETNGFEKKQENNNESLFIQNDFENRPKSFYSAITAQREEILDSYGEEEQNSFQDFSERKNVHDGCEFFNFEEYEDILDTETHERIINWTNNCPMGAIIEENEDIVSDFEDSNREIEKVADDYGMKEELSFKIKTREWDKNEGKWAEMTNKVKKAEIVITSDAMSKISENNTEEKFSDKMIGKKCIQNEKINFGMTRKAFSTDEKNIKNLSEPFTTNVKYSPLKMQGEENLKTNQTVHLANKNDSLDNHCKKNDQSQKVLSHQGSKTQSKQKVHFRKYRPNNNSDNNKDNNAGKSVKNCRKKSISLRGKAKTVKNEINADAQNFRDGSVDYCESIFGGKKFFDIDVPTQVKKKNMAIVIEEFRNSLEVCDNNSTSSSELSCTTGNLSSGQCHAMSNEFKNGSAAPTLAFRENDQIGEVGNHSIRNEQDFPEGEDVEGELNARCSSASSESLLDEFLDRSSRLRILRLQKKLQAQTVALDHLKKVNQQLAEEKQHRQRRLQESEALQRRTAAQLRQAKLTASAAEQRRAAADEQAKLQLKKYQTAMTEVAALRRSSAAHSAADPGAIRRLQNNLAAVTAVKEKLDLQVQTLQTEASSAAAEQQQQLSQLRLQVRQLQLLLQKQRQLIAVLQKQKISIMAAKATECVERKLNSIVSDRKNGK